MDPDQTAPKEQSDLGSYADVISRRQFLDEAFDIVRVYLLIYTMCIYTVIHVNG